MTPEPFWNLRNSVNSDAVNVVFVNEVPYPTQKCCPYVVVFLFEVGEFGQSAVLDAVLVMVGEVGVGDVAPIVVVARVVEGSVDSEVSVEVSHMIGDHVDHHQNSPLVAGADEVDEILLRAEVIVEPIKVPPPITVVSPIAIVDDWGDPNGIKAHSLDIVQVVYNPSVPSSTVVSYI